MRGLVIDQWVGIFAPAGTPPAAAVRLGTEIRKALADPTVRDRLLASGQEPAPGTSEAFTGFVHEEFGKYRQLVHQLDIKLE